MAGRLTRFDAGRVTGDAGCGGDLHQWPAAARQQRDRLRLELIRKVAPFPTHSTPSRSSRSLPKVSPNPGEGQKRRGFALYEAFRPDIPAGARGGVQKAISI